MIQSKIGRDLTGSAIHEYDQEAGEYHGQRIELGHPGYQYSGKSLSTCNRGSHSMIDASYQKQAYQSAQCTGSVSYTHLTLPTTS